MLNFIGKQEAKADVKGRVFIPSAYRKLLPEGDKERVVMRRDPENDYLVLYPIPVWNEMVQELKS
ncbi:cell division/cell wall cluster transcriptional repressor MraZ, partial [bacterium]|nr:cell division/cell wall cluster transcriptional repressor MraZ [bacterium]